MLRFNDEKLGQTSGIFFENTGSITIIITYWNSAAYVNLTYYNSQWDILDQYITETERMRLNHNVDTNCDDLLMTTMALANDIKI